MQEHGELPAVRKTTVLAVMFVLFVVGVGQSFVFTSLPPIGREIGLSEAQIGTIVTAAAVLLVIFSFVWARLIDIIGRRRSMQFGILVYAITTGLLGYVYQRALNGQLDAHTTWLLSMLLRGTFTACSAGVFPSAQSYFVSISNQQNRAAYIANLGVAYSLGMVIGPVIAAIVSNYGLTMPFFFIPVLCVVALLLLQWFMPSAERSEQALPPQSIDWQGHPILWLLLLSFMVMFSLSGIQQVIVFYVQDLLQLGAQASTQKGGVALTIMSASMILVQLVAAQKLALPPHRMIYFGGGLLLAGMIVMIVLPVWNGVLLGMGLLGAGIGFLFPAVIASQTLCAEPHQQSRIAGVNSAAQGMGYGIGPLLCASLYQWDSVFPFIIVAFFAISITVIYRIWHRHHKAQFGL